MDTRGPVKGGAEPGTPAVSRVRCLSEACWPPPESFLLVGACSLVPSLHHCSCPCSPGGGWGQGCVSWGRLGSGLCVLCPAVHTQGISHHRREPSAVAAGRRHEERGSGGVPRGRVAQQGGVSALTLRPVSAQALGSWCFRCPGLSLEEKVPLGSCGPWE